MTGPRRRRGFGPPLRPPTPEEAGSWLRSQGQRPGIPGLMAKGMTEALMRSAKLMQDAGTRMEKALQPPAPAARRTAPRSPRPRARRVKVES